MKSAEYHFITHWQIKGPRELVYKILTEGEDYPKWWKPAYVACETIAPKTIKATVRAKLPYTLTFTTQVVREKPPEEFEIRAIGELDGTGCWQLRQKGEYTKVDYYWNVRATKPLVQYLSFLLKPLFVWNHNWVMNTGETALQAEVDRRIGSR